MATAPLIILIIVLVVCALVRPPGERRVDQPLTLQRALRGVAIGVVALVGLYLVVVLLMVWGHAHRSSY